MMRNLYIIVLATLQLCSARNHVFNIHEDLLAFPQYEVVFIDEHISEKDASSILGSVAGNPTVSADSSQQTGGDAENTDQRHRKSTSSSLPLTYEVINMSPHKYLCSIPVLETIGPENQTATELAKAEEAREMNRAAASGWDLVSQLEDTCLYFMSGWWSYKFCNNREIVQFHALASIPDGQPPRRDPQTAEFYLGRTPTIPASSETYLKSDPNAQPVPAELQAKGDQRYLVQRLGGGTTCDITGRDRTIEVQYHCVPGLKNDRIGWIKEVTICAYVMVVNTARLCDDVAFLPPEDIKATPITCQLISDDQGISISLLDQESPKQDDVTGGAVEQPEQKEPLAPPPLVVGGILIGGRTILSAGDKEGEPPLKLAVPRNLVHSPKLSPEHLLQALVQAKSKADGGEAVLTAADLEQLDLQPELIEEMREQMEKLVGTVDWEVEIVDLPGDEERELRVYIHTDDDDKPIGKTDKASDEKARNKGAGTNDGKAGKAKKKERVDKAPPSKNKDKKQNTEVGSDEGSEEQFFKKDEL